MHYVLEELSQKLSFTKSIPFKNYFIILIVSFLSTSIVSIYLAKVFIEKSLKEVLIGLDNVPKRFPEQLNLSFPATLLRKDFEMIPKRNLFDHTQEAKDLDAGFEQSEEITDQVVRTELNLKLLGTIYGGTIFSGISVIQNPSRNNSVNSFVVGDYILPDAILQEIHRDRIVFSYNGQRQYLEILQTVVKRTNRKAKNSPNQSFGVDNDSAFTIASDVPPDNFKEEGFERKNDKIDMSLQYKETLLTRDFAKVLQDAKATPNIENGELKGFKLTKIRKGSIYDKAGFMNEDIVEEINGVPLTDTAKSIQLLNSLRNETEIEVRTKRNGKVSNKVINIK